MKKLGKVRRSQLISTYGIGSIIPLEEGSVMVAGLEKWPVGPYDINEPRLSGKLGVKGFIRPPASGNENRNDIPVVRFPTVYYCPGDCKRLADFGFMAAPASNICQKCNIKLIPSRFVSVCPKGHIDDFPYFDWVHANQPRMDVDRHILTLHSKGISASLRDIEISCTCGIQPRSMEGSFSFSAVKDIGKCSGRRPWIGDHEECDQISRTLQRGASNVYFPIAQSALAIPPWSEGAYLILSKYWQGLSNIPESALLSFIEGQNLAAGTPYSPEQLTQVFIQRKQSVSSVSSLLDEEYAALCEGHAETERSQDFVCEEAPGRDEVSDIFEKVMIVPKLKEVRALTAFTRMRPPAADNDVNVAKLSYNPPEWLPAIEVRGEGMFFKLSNDEIEKWEATPAVGQRADKIDQNYRDKMTQLKLIPQRKVTPRFLLIHTFAHALIQQWALDCGYPAGSLRERLYVSEPSDEIRMTGLLIYTATSDAAGSLGGLVALADAKRLRESVINAVLRVAWCSADPLCVEADASGTDALNLAACHACVLLPETSCEQQNYFLDRAMLIGTPKNPEIGFLKDLLK